MKICKFEPKSGRFRTQWSARWPAVLIFGDLLFFAFNEMRPHFTWRVKWPGFCVRLAEAHNVRLDPITGTRQLIRSRAVSHSWLICILIRAAIFHRVGQSPHFHTAQNLILSVWTFSCQWPFLNLKISFFEQIYFVGLSFMEIEDFHLVRWSRTMYRSSTCLTDANHWNWN